ncbi:MAG: FliG C-terminal domain-containing protein [Planctomycetota bacterium]
MADRSGVAGGAQHFAWLEKVEPGRIASVLSDESARVGAIVLSHIDRTHAAKVLGGIDAKARGRIAAAMSGAQKTPAAVLEQIAGALREKVYQDAPAADTTPDTVHAPAEPAPGMVQYGGPEVAAAILRYAAPEVRRNLQQQEPDLFGKLKRLMFTFDDFAHTPDRGLQILFGEVDIHELALALKVAEPALRRRILGAMSHRRAQLVEDEIERLGRVRMRDIEEARSNIVDRALALQAHGRVVLGDEEELVD